MATVPIITKTVVCSSRTDVAVSVYSLRRSVEQLVESDTRRCTRTYTEIGRIYRKSIDATCLRVNKQLPLEVSAILYGYNTLDCSYIPCCTREEGRLRILGHNSYPFLRSAKKPATKKLASPCSCTLCITSWKAVKVTKTLQAGYLASHSSVFPDPSDRVTRQS